MALSLVVIAFVALGCGRQRPAVSVTQMPSAVTSRHAAALDPDLLAETVGERDGDAYRLGPGDLLLVAVYGHPELSVAPFVPLSTPGPQGGRPAGLLIDNDGTVQLPLLGSVRVQGQTSERVRQLVEEGLATYIKDPKVTVQVLFNGNIRYYLFGEFTSPGLKYSDRPLGLLEALSLGGSVDLDKASLRTAYVARRGRKIPVNFRRLILDGDLTQNMRLKTGDIVVVPSQQTEQAFVFGGFPGSDPAGGAVPFVNGSLTLLQALARAGFGQSERFQGALSDVHVIRSEGDHGELFIVDAHAIMEGKAAQFDLAPGDVIFVPATTLANWNQALDMMLPSLQTIAGILTPFVQVKYLSQ
ncbi:MAG: polysaccharide biosynthesis/export family protein [Polyangiaceae bacterium]|jgi:polysaccharide export outer membrane protein